MITQKSMPRKSPPRSLGGRRNPPERKEDFDDKSIRRIFGIGGFRSALERVGGFEFAAWCEIDKFAQKAYRALYDTGGEQFYKNIRDIDAGELADFDLLVAGFPC